MQHRERHCFGELVQHCVFFVFAIVTFRFLSAFGIISLWMGVGSVNFRELTAPRAMGPMSPRLRNLEIWYFCGSTSYATRFGFAALVRLPPLWWSLAAYNGRRVAEKVRARRTVATVVALLRNDAVRSTFLNMQKCLVNFGGFLAPEKFRARDATSGCAADRCATVVIC